MREKNLPRKPTAITYILARELTAVCHTLSAVLKMVAAGDRIGLLGTPPPIEQWLAFYESNGWMGKLAREYLPKPFGRLAAQILTSDFENWINQIDELTLKKLIAEFARNEPDPLASTSGKKNRLIRIAEKMQSKAIPPRSKSAALNFSPDLQFLLRVWIPVWFSTNETVSVVFGRACDGNDDDIASLIRIDKSLVSHPRIAGHLHNLSHNENRHRFRRITSAYAGRLSKSGTSVSAVKMKLAALLSLFASQYESLTSPEIRHFFDEHAKRESNGTISTDQHFDLTLETLQKKINRERKKQMASINPDKRKAKSVRAENARIDKVSTVR